MKISIYILLFTSLLLTTQHTSTMEYAIFGTGLLSSGCFIAGTFTLDDLNTSDYRAYENYTDEQIKEQKRAIP